jgi:N-acetylglutamate synthase-like GNAT family acetyltransferase
MDLIIREIAIEDIDEITELYIETYKKEPWNENWKKEIAKERIKDFIENNTAENYCINNENRIIGAMFARRNYYKDRKELYIDEFFIEYGNQRKGIGKFFMEYIEKDIKQKNYSSMVLLTKKAFPSEIFYQNIGFSILPNMILLYKGIK